MQHESTPTPGDGATTIGGARLDLGDCRDVLATLPPASVDAVVCDPPYDLTAVSRRGSPRTNSPVSPFGRHHLRTADGFGGPVTFGGRKGRARFPAPRDEAGTSAARFYSCAKASRRDREEGPDGLPRREGGPRSEAGGRHLARRDGAPAPVRNHHPTVKPTALMRDLCRLATPPGGAVLDPFMGSGSTGKAARLEGLRFVGVERGADDFEIAAGRIGVAAREPDRSTAA